MVKVGPRWKPLLSSLLFRFSGTFRFKCRHSHLEHFKMRFGVGFGQGVFFALATRGQGRLPGDSSPAHPGCRVPVTTALLPGRSLWRSRRPLLCEAAGRGGGPSFSQGHPAAPRRFVFYSPQMPSRWLGGRHRRRRPAGLMPGPGGTEPAPVLAGLQRRHPRAPAAQLTLGGCHCRVLGLLGPGLRSS